MIKVSIIVPVYNTEGYLKRCLDSLVCQTMDDIEILIVNDGSTDNSQEIIDEYVQKYSNIKSLKKENGGLSDARNFAIPHAVGKYIGFVDSDDFIEPNMYEKMYDIAYKNNSDIVECNFIWEYPNKITNDNGIQYSNISDCFLYGRVMACNKLIRADILKNNNIKFPIGLRYEDIEFFYKLIPFVKKYSLIENSLYHYIQRENSIINNQNIKNSDIFTILDNLTNFYKENNLYEKYKNELEYLYIRLLLGSSFLRIVKIQNKDIRKNLLNKTIYELYTNFPNWKKNKLLKINNKKNFYYRTVNKFTFKIYSFIFKFI